MTVSVVPELQTLGASDSWLFLESGGTVGHEFHPAIGCIHVRHVVTRMTAPRVGAIDPQLVPCPAPNHKVSDDAVPLLG